MLKALLAAVVIILTVAISPDVKAASECQAFIDGSDGSSLLILPPPKTILLSSPVTIPITVKSSEPAFEIKNFSLGSYVIDQIDRSEYKRNSLKNIEQFLDDANGDGVLDLIVIARGEAPFATVIYSVCNAAEQWGEHVSLSTEPLGENDTITVEDVNGDGKLDIVIQYNDRSGQYAALANAVGGWSAVQRILKGENGSWGMPSYVTGASAFQVDASMGSASFIQPISVPTGRAGVQPDLAIQYSSTGGYSELGQSVGLSLKSAISRCGSSYLRDGIVKEVSLTNNDYACLDGVRLILLAGEYWGNGSRYRPESGHQYEVEYSTGGTTSFVVTHSNGDVYTYGGSVDSTVKGGQPIEVNAKWALRRATDRVKQGYLINYINNSAANLIESITYTVAGQDVSGPANVLLHYERDDYQPHAYVYGKKYDLGLRLKSIEARYAQSLYRKYHFVYMESDYTGKAYLKEIIECTTGNTCFEGNQIAWSIDSDRNFSEITYSTDLGFQGSVAARYSTWSDIDRDGKDDYCRISYFFDAVLSAGCFTSTENGSLDGFVSLNVDISGDGAFDTTKPNTSNWNRDGVWVDIDKDGFADFCFSRPNNTTTDKLVCFTRDASGNVLTVENTALVPRPVPRNQILTRQWVDFNGDGETDYCISYIRSNGKVFVSCSTKEKGQFAYQSAIFTKEVESAAGMWADVNADGMPDYCWTKNQNVKCHTNNGGDDLEGGGWAHATNNVETDEPGSWGEITYGSSYYRASMIDFNGNGYNDFCRIYRHTQSGESGYRATCSVSTGKGWSDDLHSPFIPSELALATMFVDINEDGWADWCIEKHEGLTCVLGRGGRFSDERLSINLPQPSYPNASYLPRDWADISGRGELSYCIYMVGDHTNIDSSSVVCYSAPEDKVVDVIEEIRNPFGLTYKVQYSDISNKNLYSYDVEAGEHGQLFATSAIQVVSKIQATDGIGGTTEASFKYENYGYYNNEIGSVGFRYIEKISENGSRKSEVWFLQDGLNHQAGLVEKSRTSVRSSQGVYILTEEVENEWKTSTFTPTALIGYPGNIWDKTSAPARYDVELRTATTKSFELNGQLSKESIVETYYSYGRPIQQTTTVRGAGQEFITEQSTQYTSDLISYLGAIYVSFIRNPEVSTISQSGTYLNEIVPGKTKSSRWEYYPSSSTNGGLLWKEIIEPDLADYRIVTEHFYNEYGLLESTAREGSDGLISSVAYSYDAAGRSVLSEENTLGHAVYYEHDPVSALKLSEVDENGVVRSWHYDDFGRPLTTINPDGSKVQVRIQQCSALCPEHSIYYIESWAESASGTLLSPHSKEYKDVLGRTIRTETKGFGGETILSLTEYDPLGRLLRQSEPFFEGEQVHWHSVTQRDPLGRVLSEISATGVVTNYVYDGLSQEETLTWIDQAGSSVTQTEEALSDVLGNVRVAKDSLGREVRFDYDIDGNKLATHLPDGSAIYNTYDHFGRRLSSSDENAGTWRYAYDSQNRIILEENGNGERICTAYDALGRVTKRVDEYQPLSSWEQLKHQAENACAGQAASTTWVYDLSGVGVGRLASISHGSSYVENFNYDGIGRLVEQKTVFEGEEYRSRNHFDPETGRISRIDMPGSNAGFGLSIEQSYNSNGYLESISKLGEPVYLWKLIATNAKNQPVQEMLSNGAVKASNDYDPVTGKVTGSRVKQALSIEWNVANESYLYNRRGQMVERTQNAYGNQASVKEVFEYDVLDRLVKNSVINQSQTAASYHQTISYGELGNISNKSDVGDYLYGQECTHEGVTYSPGPHAVTQISGNRAASYCYDDMGNMLEGGGNVIEYYAFGRASSISNPSGFASYHYGPSREILKQLSETSGSSNVVSTETVFLDNYQKTVQDENGITSTKERYTIGSIVLIVDDGDYVNAEERYSFYDAMGSLFVVVDAFGQSMERYRYDPWGKPRNVTLWDEMNDASWAQMDRAEAASTRGFTGHLMVDFANLIHAGGRIYDPVIARFTSIDPVVLGQANPEAYNRYSYVVNNPMNYNDPSGYFRSGTGIGGSIKRELKRFERKFKDQLLDFATGGLYSSVKYTSRELARFAEKNKFAGQILGVVGMVGCAYANVAAASCMTAFQGFTSGAIAYGSGGSFEDVLFAASKSAALAFANAHMAGQIGATTKGIQGLAAKSVVSGGLHGLRGGVFAMFAGGDFRSGLVGGLTEGALAPSFGGSLGNAGYEVAVTALVSGSVSQITGGNFAIGAEQGAMGYLFNWLATHGGQMALAHRNQVVAKANASMGEEIEPYLPDNPVMVAGGAGQVIAGAATCYFSVGTGCPAGGALLVASGGRDIYRGWSGEDPYVQPLVAAGLLSDAAGDNISRSIDMTGAAYGVSRGIFYLHSLNVYKAAESVVPVYTSN